MGFFESKERKQLEVEALDRISADLVSGGIDVPGSEPKYGSHSTSWHPYSHDRQLADDGRGVFERSYWLSHCHSITEPDQYSVLCIGVICGITGDSHVGVLVEVYVTLQAVSYGLRVSRCYVRMCAKESYWLAREICDVSCRYRRKFGMVQSPL